MNERSGWVLLAIGVLICALGWLLFVLAAYLFGTQLGERLFLCA
jgi:hypothetical protein